MTVVVLGASGAVGAWACEHLVEPGGAAVRVDSAGPADHRCDVLAPTAAAHDAVAAAHLVVLALPQPVVAGCLEWVLAASAPAAPVVTTCSVQGPVFDHPAVAGAGRELLGVNPLFSPTLSHAGRSVALVSTGPGPGADLVHARLRAGEMVVEPLSPEVHDTALSYLQALPHAAVLGFLTTLAQAPVDPATLARLAPPPARTMLALASRILTGAPEVYWDIQHGNPGAAARRHELRASLATLDSAVAAGLDQFCALLSAPTARLSEQVAVGADDCAVLFDALGGAS